MLTDEAGDQSNTDVGLSGLTWNLEDITETLSFIYRNETFQEVLRMW